MLGFSGEVASSLLVGLRGLDAAALQVPWQPGACTHVLSRQNGIGCRFTGSGSALQCATGCWRPGRAWQLQRGGKRRWWRCVSDAGSVHGESQLHIHSRREGTMRVLYPSGCGDVGVNYTNSYINSHSAALYPEHAGACFASRHGSRCTFPPRQAGRWPLAWQSATAPTSCIPACSPGRSTRAEACSSGRRWYMAPWLGGQWRGIAVASFGRASW